MSGGAAAAEGLDDELKYLADADAARAHAALALFRVIVWAIPILGFLGTVIGITMALNGIDPKAMDESMLQVLDGLGVKFDTTALALAMSMVLMFVHFFVDRAENALLEEVDRRVEADLAGRFRSFPPGRRPVGGGAPDGRDDAAGDRAAGPAAGRVVAGLDGRGRRPLGPAGRRRGRGAKKGLAAALAEGLKPMPSTWRPPSRRPPRRTAATGTSSSRARRRRPGAGGACRRP